MLVLFYKILYFFQHAMSSLYGLAVFVGNVTGTACSLIIVSGRALQKAVFKGARNHVPICIGKLALAVKEVVFKSALVLAAIAEGIYSLVVPALTVNKIALVGVAVFGNGFALSLQNALYKDA